MVLKKRYTVIRSKSGGGLLSLMGNQLNEK
jgi:hypothetical protein